MQKQYEFKLSVRLHTGNFEKKIKMPAESEDERFKKIWTE
jgi:hypothetical protein